MNHIKYIIRKGHLGDVILTEPIARAIKKKGNQVILVTDYEHAHVLLPVYDEVLPYSYYTNVLAKSKNAEFVVLAYELHPQLHYVEGFAMCAGVDIGNDKKPMIRNGFSPVVTKHYCLIAPHTSSWARGMREWSFSRYKELAQGIEYNFGLNTVFLKPEHSFEELLGLIEHCSLFIGNDSGPGIIAQAFTRPSLILFGATGHSKVLFSEYTDAVLVDVGCNGCRQWSRNSLVSCNAPICMDSISVNHVLECVNTKIPKLNIRGCLT